MESTEKDRQIPSFKGLLCNGETFRNHSFEEVKGERGTIFIFFGFTFNAISENWWRRYEKAGLHDIEEISVYGVSRDGPYAQNAFIRYLESPFQMFSDHNGDIIKKFNLLTDRHHMANTSTSKRAIIVVDSAGKIKYQWIADNWTSPAPLQTLQDKIADL